MQRLIRLDDVFAKPAKAADSLVRDADIFGLVSMEVRCADSTTVVYRLVLDPWKMMAAEDYPRETVGILIMRDGHIFACPHNDGGRRWKHRYPEPMKHLCLWYPNDPRKARWEWEDGLAKFITITHRHLMAEECWRRSGHMTWPGREAPHGDGGGEGKSRWALW